jgi:hypothetical protein
MASPQVCTPPSMPPQCSAGTHGVSAPARPTYRPRPPAAQAPGARPPVDLGPHLAEMAGLVQAGDFVGAAAAGQRAPFPLSIPAAALRGSALLSEGAQAAVYRATLHLPAAAQAGEPGEAPGRPVAVKRPRIREPADLLRCACGWTPAT